MSESELKTALLHVVEDYRDDLGDDIVIDALEHEIDRVQDSEANHGLQEFAQ